MNSHYPIDPADLRTALGTSMRNAQLQRLYKEAPEGAKPVLKVLFCAEVFPEKLSREGMWANIKDLEAGLSEEDVVYLAENWEDADVREYFSQMFDAGSRPKAKIGIIRNKEPAKKVDLNAEAIKRRMALQEEQERLSREKAEMNRRKKARDLFIRRAVACSLAGCLIVIGCVLFSNMRRERMVREAARKAAQAAEQAAEQAERAALAEKEKREREEKIAKANLKREEEEKKRQREEQEREAKNKAEREAREREFELLRKKKELEKGYFKKYQSVKRRFEGAALVPWKQLASSQKPGAVNGVFVCAMRDENGCCEFYEIVSRASGESKAFKLSEGAAPEEVSYTAWQSEMKKNGGIIGDGRKVYLFTPAQKGDRPLPPSWPFSPSQMRLGPVCGLIRRFQMDMSGFSFAVKLRGKGCKEHIAFDPVVYGETLAWYAVEKKITEMAEATVKKPKPKRIRRTVIMYDGPIIKKQLNGVVLVPMNPTNYNRRYQELRDEAVRQEQMDGQVPETDMARYRAEVLRKVQDALSSITADVMIKYEAP